jgi:4-amino-4-deoxy-L-arabinose transferase-like glycosyltransferase
VLQRRAFMTSIVALGRRHARVVLLAAAMGAVAVLVHLHVFPYLSRDADESAYLLQAEALARGQLTLPASLHAGPFQPWLTGEHGGQVFTKYLPGWPALIAASLAATGEAAPALFVVAAGLVLAVYVFALELFEGRRTALIAAAVTALSPLFLVHTATFLSYPFATALLLAASTCWIRGTRLRSRPLLLGAGALYGWAFLVRPLDVVLVAGPVAAYLWARHRGTPRRLGRSCAWAVVGGVPFLAVTLAYNAAVTGAPLRMPLPATDAMDRFGFGPRRIMPLFRVYEYNPAQAWEALVQQARAMPSWTFGGALLLALALLGLFARTRRLERLLLLGVVLAFPVGYFPFWGSFYAPTRLGMLNGIGPLYWLPVLAVLAVLAAAGTESVLGWLLGRGRRPTVAATMALTVLACSLTALNLRDKITFHRDVANGYATVAALVPPPEQLRTPATVVVYRGSYVGNPYPFLRNDPSLDNPITYAAARGRQAVRVAELVPSRALYALRPLERHRADDPGGPRGSFEELAVVRGRQLRIEAEVRVPAGGRCLVAFVYLDRRTYERPLACGVRPGDVHRTTWTVGGPGGLPVPEIGADVELVVGAAVNDRPDLDGARKWERRDSLGVRPGEGQPVLTVLTPGPGFALPSGKGRWLPSRVDDVITHRTDAVGS